MHRPPENGDARLDERVEALATCVDEIAERVRATELATGDEKTAKELRRALEAVAKHDPKLESRLIDRVDVLMDRLGTLASAVSTTSAELARRDGDLAALRRELGHGSARVEALAKDVNQAARVVDVEKLRQAIAERPAERPAQSGSERLDRFEGKIALLAERIDTLSPTVAAAASGLAARDGELANLRQKLERSVAEVERVIAEVRADPRIGKLETATQQLAGKDGEVIALRARIDDGYAKASAAISGLQLSLATVESRIGAMEKLPERVEHALAAQAGEFDTRLQTVSGTVSATMSRLADLETASSEQAATKEAQAHELERLSTEAGAQLDGLTMTVARLERSAASDESGRRLSELDTRLKALSGTVDGTVGKLAALETASAEKTDRIANALTDGKASLQAQLDGLVAVRAHAERSTASDESERTLAELTGRIDLLSGELATVTSAIADRESEVPALRARIDDAYAKASAVVSELQLSLAALLSRVGVLEDLPERLEERFDLLEELGMRLGLVEQRGEAPAEEIEKILDTWASDRSSLETRLDVIAAALTGTGSGRGNAGGWDAEVIRLRVLVDGLQMRLSASEEEIAALRSAPDLASRFDEITNRLVAIERSTHGVFASSNGPAAGDGRFRLELRALELRLEQEAATAHDGRDAFLVQLERMASRIEWRLQRLESKDADPPYDDPTPTGAKVVPFRSAEV